jgi:hypothetical protein
MAIPKLGGKNGNLVCGNDGCNNKRYPRHELCTECWGEENEGGTRNSRGMVIQARLKKEVWVATQFASRLIRNRKPYHEAVKIASGYYKVDKADVYSALSQRSGLNQKGK